MDTTPRKVYTVDDLARLWDETVRRIVENHEARIRVLEQRQSVKQTVVSAVVSVIAAVATIFASGCALPEPQKPKTQGELAESVVRLELYADGEFQGLGTAWFVRPDVLATAAHVCETGFVHAFEVGGEPQFASVLYDRDSNPYEFNWDIHYPDLGAAEGPCLLQVISEYRGTPLRLRGQVKVRHPPLDAEVVSFYGFPEGLRGKAEGFLTDEEDGYLVATDFPAWFGASGSAVIGEDGQVVGIVSAIFPGSSITLIIPVEAVWDAVREAGV